MEVSVNWDLMLTIAGGIAIGNVVAWIVTTVLTIVVVGSVFSQ